MHYQLPLLCSALDGNKVHVGSTGGFTDCRRIIGIVLTTLASHAVWGDKVRCDQPCIQALRSQLPGHMVRAAAGFSDH